jgi:hypothetical protein
MGLPWGLAALFLGVAYGVFTKGKQNKSELFKGGLIFGFVLGTIFAIIGLLAKSPALGYGGLLAAVISAFVITVVFVLGVWIGDVLEVKARRK